MRLASRLPPDPYDDAETLSWYARALEALHAARVPFLIGGAYALKHHTGIVRDTKDLDIFLRQGDLDRALATLAGQGFRTEIPFPHWLAKAHAGDRFIDIIYNSGNGMTPVDLAWFEHAESATLLDVPVAICPAEETVWSKAFVMERERYDGADVSHILLGRRASLDGRRLIDRFGSNYRVLLAHLVLFGFAFPREARDVPAWVMRELYDRTLAEPTDASEPPVCRGTIISREQYLIDTHERGYRDGRLPPTGSMTPEQVEAWTEAIGAPH